LKAGVWFRRGRLLIGSPDSLGTACPLSGRNSTYRPVQILEAGSDLGEGFPRPADATRAGACAQLAALPSGALVVVDGLALGVLPEAARALCRARKQVARMERSGMRGPFRHVHLKGNALRHYQFASAPTPG
jgi:hypothetical protein